VSARTRTIVIVLWAVAVGAAVVMRHARGAMGKGAPGGILIGNASLYDALSHRLLLGSLSRRIAADVASVAPQGAKVLEVGCGPGRLSILLAREYGFEVTGLDLDPAMIERARANAARDAHEPQFIVGDVASMALADGAFDIVVSTLSLHHWDDPTAGLTEIGRVLRPGGRALVWDFRGGRVPLHGRLPDPVEHVRDSPLVMASTSKWRWPWRFTLTERRELLRPDRASEGPGTSGAARSS
jgi:SAM-dependent methyltransferase